MLILGLLAKFSEALRGPALNEKATGQSKILDLGSHNSLLQHDMWPTFFLSKITPPYCNLHLTPRPCPTSAEFRYSTVRRTA